ncbi:MAG: TauD/TfdA family dioxygenase [Dinghuibacter sp.]|nr:TauD/TfdA family dioxygenase [Dinghuibacter sp.]
MDTLAVEPLGAVQLVHHLQPGITDINGWAQEVRNGINDHLNTHGALLVRGLNIASPEDFSSLLRTLFDDPLLNYVYRSTPRKELTRNIYTATEYPETESIPQHNENAYANAWPMRIGFWCVEKAAVQGNTPICDSRIVYRHIPAPVREVFEQKQVMYVRNYADVDLSWKEVFQTENPAEVEAYCRENQIDFEWTENGLRTRQVNPATAVHPVTGEKIWFNQAHLFHVSALPDEVREGLTELLGEENLPRNTYFGDGSPIPGEMLNTIREVYNEHSFYFEWQPGDLLLLDNMLYSHGRQPYEGKRKVLVGMARIVHK